MTTITTRTVEYPADGLTMIGHAGSGRHPAAACRPLGGLRAQRCLRVGPRSELRGTRTRPSRVWHGRPAPRRARCEPGRRVGGPVPGACRGSRPACPGPCPTRAAEALGGLARAAASAGTARVVDEGVRRARPGRPSNGGPSAGPRPDEPCGRSGRRATPAVSEQLRPQLGDPGSRPV
ncbi:hypothetical protein GTW78_29885 [Streptomyces sp. SID4948]|nr:hypothetical protein [Streptomyces sp. SID4948]